MKKLLEFFLSVLLWFFYYHTTVGITNDPLKIDYHNFTINTVIFSVSYIFSGICLFCKKENEVPKSVILLIGSFYIILCFVFFSCISLEFLLQERDSNDLIIGIPGLFTIIKLNIFVYTKCMLIFPILNTTLEILLASITFKKGEME